MRPARPDPLGSPAESVKVWNVANALTLLRILLVPLFGWLLLRHGGQDEGWRIAAFVAFAVASFTDLVDGDLARKRGLVTDVGKIADPIADKALTGTALVALSVLGELAWWVTVVILVREIGVTLLRFWVIRHGVIPASRGGKLKTLLQAVAIGFYVLPLPDWLGWLPVTVMAAALVVTVVTGLDYVARAVVLRRTSERTAAKRAAREARRAGRSGSGRTARAPGADPVLDLPETPANAARPAGESVDRPADRPADRPGRAS
ncbi:MAG TPA: CDP-diacylglycerol--glycerol-3-phosphate 3-phosphatidyltransferase [Motilibacteraceae bacterium]|nr:CDP-diacylglycerol--glycerol-3-phosphate 3-phosphatidyltransferase [Motilibacteraceae bacterium]